ncbi:helix-turn-helix domain-containing protein [Lachnospiraceae bacterium HCP28S3_F9]
MPNIQLANNLKYLRKKHNLTQTTLSQILNISRQAYSNYETSKRTPDLDSLLQLTTFYQVNLNDLVLGNLQDTTIYSDKVSETVVPYTFGKDKKTGNTIYLTDEELDLITQFRTLSKENKQIITGFLHSNSKNSV